MNSSIETNVININSNIAEYDFSIDATINDIQFQGSYYKILCQTENINLTALHYLDMKNPLNIKIGDNIQLSWNKMDITNLDD